MTIEVTRPPRVDGADEILAPDALAFVEELHRRFDATRLELLDLRVARRDEIAREGTLDFAAETASIRQSDWRVAPIPAPLRDRRVEITGPAASAKMAINALNSGATVWLADLEDASSPTWENVVAAIKNLRDAARGGLTHTTPEGRTYAVRSDAVLPTVITRPRGWHMPERHIRFDGRMASGALVDFGLHFFHTAQQLIRQGAGPFYYLPKIESRHEARLWNDVFVHAQYALGIPQGTIRATVLIETITAAFEMDEILFELRDHAAGLNAGRWDYLFSLIKTFRDRGEEFVLPDRSDVSMTAPFLRAYTELLVKTCHRRGAAAIGGMAAAVPDRDDPEVTAAAIERVRADKTREAGDGFDGSWVAHPDLVPVCREVFDDVLGAQPNQIERQRPDVAVSAADLLDVSSVRGGMTELGLRTNLSVAVEYTAAWLQGSGAVALRNLMEDAATAEISRSQVWQQLLVGARLEDSGERVTPALVERVLAEEVEKLRRRLDPVRFATYYVPAARLVADVCLDDEYVDFLTLPAYDLLDERQEVAA